MAKSVEGVGEAVNSDANSDPKQLARQLLSEGFDVDVVVEESGLSRMVVLGISGAMKKASKRLAASEDKDAKGSASENVGEEELATAFKKEAQVANNAVLAARGKQRLRNLDPNSYKELYGIPPGQSEVGPAAKLIDLEIIRQLRDMRQEEPSHQNNGDSSETAVLKKEVTDLKEALRQKDLQSLRDENAKINEELKEIRSEMRSLPNSGSDLAALVKSTENIIIKAVESEGPIRRYLTPDGINIQKPSDAPKLQPQIETRSGVLEELRRHGLVTKIVERPAS